MHRTGLAPYGQEDNAVRWVAVRHGGDHIHIVAMLARQDGAKPRLSNERYRVRDACRAAEELYGLRCTAPGDRTAARRPTRAENEKAQRHRRPESPRITLKRVVSTAAAGASSEQEFFTRLARAGVLVRRRLSTRRPGEVTGYAVALPGDTTRTGTPVWFSGRKLATDLTLPRLRHRWKPGPTASGQRFTSANEVRSGNTRPAPSTMLPGRSATLLPLTPLPQPMPHGPQPTPCTPPRPRCTAG